ncbi:MAG TPA: aminoglycoside phosphotransferase family protein, partial [Candidatus Agrococcus pullicola]|nr:aminoglycoside phosphotransferase family protein [Candidatus Agrococcus pullicola]
RLVKLLRSEGVTESRYSGGRFEQHRASMETLSQAVALRRKREWDAAIDLLTGDGAAALEGSEAWFIELARNYRLANRHDEAKHLLDRAERECRTVGGILAERYQLLTAEADWASAATVARQLIDSDPTRAKNHFLLGRALRWPEDEQRIREAFVTAISLAHGASIETVIDRVHEGLAPHLGSGFRTEYRVCPGRNNLGSLVHSDDDERYYTKIAPWPGAIRREARFYQSIVPLVPELEDLTPRLIDGRLLDDVFYLTLQHLDEQSEVEDAAVVQLAVGLSRIDYGRLRGIDGLGRRPMWLDRRPATLSRFFKHLHRKSANRELFSQLERVLEANSYSPQVRRLTAELSALVQRSRAYDSIRPEDHYCLAHNDFVPANLATDPVTSSLKMIDCSSVGVGLRFLDLATYFANQQRPFQDLEACFERFEALRQTSAAERIYVNLVFLFYRILHGGPAATSEIQDSVIAPAAAAIRRSDCVREHRRTRGRCSSPPPS